MNCRTFERGLDDWLRDDAPGAAAAPRAHAATCARCRARLADARALRAGLRGLAAADENRDAPAVVETALLAAFRRQAEAPPAAPRPRLRMLNWRWAWAAAAALLLASGLLIYRAVRPAPNAMDAMNAGDRVVVRPAQSPSPPVVAPTVVPAAVESPPTVAPPRRLLARGRRDNRIAPVHIRESITAYASDSEETTEFVLLGSEDERQPVESGQLIRVRMPRATLARFGLPVNLEQADVPVKADVLVGEDGLARAIRFVR
jgi:hypothetical protein